MYSFSIVNRSPDNVFSNSAFNICFRGAKFRLRVASGKLNFVSGKLNFVSGKLNVCFGEAKCCFGELNFVSGKLSFASGKLNLVPQQQSFENAVVENIVRSPFEESSFISTLLADSRTLSTLVPALPGASPHNSAELIMD